MADFHGRFCWHELMTTDRPASTRFYGAVAGWGTRPGPVPGTDYTLLTVGDTPVGGMMDQPEECRRLGLPPNWLGYVAVDDVDATLALATELGAVQRVAPTDIPDVGRFAVFSDPQGAPLALLTPAQPSPGPCCPPGTAGTFGWNELWAADGDAAFAFYSRLFGWRKGEAKDMGAMGTYQMFALGDTTLGGMAAKPPSCPAPFWLYYVEVPDIDAAAAAIAANGGTVTLAPMAVPGGWIVQGRDPQGAMFALFGQRA